MAIGSNNILVNKIIGTLTLLFFVTSAFGQAAIVQPVGTVIESGKHYLKMRVWNCTNKDIDVPLADLPWGQHTLGLVLYPGGELAGEPLKESFPLADIPDTAVTIKLKNYVEGKIDLDYRFHDIARYEKRGALLIFWEYDLKFITGGNSQIVGGMVPLNGVSSFDGEQRIACGTAR